MLLSWALPVDRVYDNWLSKDVQAGDAVLRPATDVTDDGEVFRIIMEMPGVTKEGLEIEVKDDVVKVRGARPATPESQKLLVNGRRTGRVFERQFTLGTDVDRERLSARLDNGMLTISLPRRAEVKPQRIEVEVG